MIQHSGIGSFHSDLVTIDSWIIHDPLECEVCRQKHKLHFKTSLLANGLLGFVLYFNPINTYFYRNKKPLHI